jgi:DNA-binding transcriptional regulator YdaS (Cro superfamily)
MLTEQEVKQRFLAEVDAAGGQRAWAAAHGVTPAYVNDIVNNRRKFSQRILAMIGVESETKVVYYDRRVGSTVGSQPTNDDEKRQNVRDTA